MGRVNSDTLWVMLKAFIKAHRQGVIAFPPASPIPNSDANLLAAPA